ncbi:P22 phage major capsid protein family protein [uncultured Roseibium sp.]|uniref:P22 phage major capsid protein family protein n=1 Tax=uncultured Roseibium sp. TaxID=1936171 RepID=UPI00262FDD22|nr:P22 phage major capsid protein family protein [uncultured Roseibium sp.]
MANTLLTSTAVTREALRILHQKLNFVGNVNRQYDDRFAKTGAKIGDTLTIRLPNEYTVRTGSALSSQDTAETSTTLQVATQKGVDLNFTSVDLTMDMDDFSERILAPAMSVLAANIEADALSMYKDVYQQVSNLGSSATFAGVANVRKKLVDSLTPQDDLSMLINTEDNVDLVDALKGLFNDSKEVSKQYKEGYIGRTGGFSFMENTLLPTHTTGSDDGTGDYLTNDASAQTGSTLTVGTGTGTLKQGDIITIDGVNRVHPETKVDTGQLMQFVITADAGASATSLSISPAIVATGGSQNVTNGAANNAAVTKVGGASAVHNISMGFHRDAFAFATADLLKPKGVDFCAREVLDGISMRIVRAYDINNDQFPCRLDVLYGYKAIRPQLACRWANN